MDRHGGERARWAGHVVVCGLDRLGLRTVEELHRLGEEVVVVARESAVEFADIARALGATIVAGSPRDEATLRAAGLPTACALVLTDDDDLDNLHAALAGQELNPELRVVVRMFNQELGRRIGALFRDCIILSASALAAPAFVAAALHEDWQERLEIAGHTLAVREATSGAGSAGPILPLARLGADGAVELFPSIGADHDRDDGDVVLCLEDMGLSAGGGGHARRRLAALRGRPALPRLLLPGDDRRLRLILGALIGLALLGTATFAYLDRLTPVDATLFIITFLTTSEFNNVELRTISPGLKLFAAGVMLLGAAALVAFYAFLTDAIVGARLNRLLGGVPRQLRDHVIVCGTGTVGYRIVEHLARLGVPVAAVELDERSRFLPIARRRGVPTLVADASLPETLRTLNVARARCLIAATGDDVANLEAALNARDLNPELRIVMRLFDPDFARRVERTLDLHTSRSVSALAAPAFALAAVGRRALAIVPVGQRVLLIAAVTIAPGSPLAGRAVADLERLAEARVLFAPARAAHWRPGGSTTLDAGDDLIVIATRAGLEEVRVLTEAALQADPPDLSSS